MMKSRLRFSGLAGAVLTAWVSVAAPANSHEPRRKIPRRTTEEIFPAGRAGLGMTEAQLREQLGTSVRPGRLSLVVSEFPETSGDGPAFLFLHRPLSGEDLVYAEYELFDGHLFRIRWCLAERYERPVLKNLMHQARHRLGEPIFDQRTEGKLGTGLAAFRRIGWDLGDRLVELRQLNPLTGGTVFLTVTEKATVKRIRDLERMVPPQPDRARPWWTGQPSVAVELSEEERWILVWSFDDILAATVAARGDVAGDGGSEAQKNFSSRDRSSMRYSFSIQ